MAYALLDNGIVSSVVDEIPESFTGMVVDITGQNADVGWKLDGNILNDGSLDCVIYDFTTKVTSDKKIPPFDLDFLTSLTIKLHRKQTMIKGEVQTEEYYQSFDGSQYSGLVVKESNTYTRDSLGFALYRTTTVEWVLKNGQMSDKKKVWKKFYDPLQMIEEGIDRRGNIIKFLQPKILGLLQVSLPANEIVNILVYGRAFLSDLKNDFENFVNHSDRALYTTLQDANLLTKHPWLTLTPAALGGSRIIDYILAEVTI